MFTIEKHSQDLGIGKNFLIKKQRALNHNRNDS